jgi:hypothetical protein
MFDTFAALTIQLARAYGAGILIVALAALLTPASMSAAIADFEKSPAVTFIAAIFALVLGLALVMLHSLWTDFPAILVSLLGWVILIKSILLFAAPQGLLKFGAAAASSDSRIRLWGVFALILGAIYLAVGLTSHATIA